VAPETHLKGEALVDELRKEQKLLGDLLEEVEAPRRERTGAWVTAEKTSGDDKVN
jgi:hypothetical protein